MAQLSQKFPKNFVWNQTRVYVHCWCSFTLRAWKSSATANAIWICNWTIPSNFAANGCKWWSSPLWSYPIFQTIVFDSNFKTGWLQAEDSRGRDEVGWFGAYGAAYGAYGLWIWCFNFFYLTSIKKLIYFIIEYRWITYERIFLSNGYTNLPNWKIHPWNQCH